MMKCEQYSPYPASISTWGDVLCDFLHPVFLFIVPCCLFKRTRVFVRLQDLHYFAQWIFYEQPILPLKDIDGTREGYVSEKSAPRPRKPPGREAPRETSHRQLTLQVVDKDVPTNACGENGFIDT